MTAKNQVIAHASIHGSYLDTHLCITGYHVKVCSITGFSGRHTQWHTFWVCNDLLFVFACGTAAFPGLAISAEAYDSVLRLCMTAHAAPFSKAGQDASFITVFNTISMVAMQITKRASLWETLLAGKETLQTVTSKLYAWASYYAHSDNTASTTASVSCVTTFESWWNIFVRCRQRKLMTRYSVNTQHDCYSYMHAVSRHLAMIITISECK